MLLFMQWCTHQCGFWLPFIFVELGEPVSIWKKAVKKKKKSSLKLLKCSLWRACDFSTLREDGFITLALFFFSHGGNEFLLLRVGVTGMNKFWKIPLDLVLFKCMIHFVSLLCGRSLLSRAWKIIWINAGLPWWLSSAHLKLSLLIGCFIDLN